MTRCQGFIERTRAALHKADANIDADTFLHPLILAITSLECSQLAPEVTAAVLATLGATTLEGSTNGNSYLFKYLVASFGARWDDEAIQRRDKSSSHRRRAGQLATAASSWDNQLVSPTIFEDGEIVSETYEWDADLDECEEESQEWVDHSNDDGWYEDFPQDDSSMSSDMKKTRHCVDATKLVAQVKSARGCFAVVGMGAFDGLQSMTPHASAGTKASCSRKGTSPSKSRGRGKMKCKREPDSRRPSPAKSRQTSSGPMNRGVAHGPTAPVKSAKWVISREIVQIADHVKTVQFQACFWQFRECGARSVDDAEHQT